MEVKTIEIDPLKGKLVFTTKDGKIVTMPTNSLTVTEAKKAKNEEK